MTQPALPDSLNPEELRLFEQAVELRKLGDHLGASVTYQELLSRLPEPPDALLFNLGNALLDAGKPGDAFKTFKRLIEISPDMNAAGLQAARAALQSGQSKEAESWFRHTLSIDHNNFSAALELANLLRRQGKNGEALNLYRKVCTIAPERHEGYLSLARILEEQGDADGGAAAYHQALLTCAGRSEQVCLLHGQMAAFRLERGSAAMALDAMRQALLVSRLADPPLELNLRCEQQITLGEILMRLGLVELAHRAFERASSATAEATLTRLAETSFRFNLWQEAQEVLRRNLDLHPTSSLAHWNLAHAYAESWQLGEAEALLAKAEAIGPQPGALSMRASIAGRLGDVDQALALYRQLAEQEGPGSAMASSAAMASLYSDQVSAEEVSQLHRQLFAGLGEGARSASSFANPRDPERRLHLGLVSADFHHQHPVNIFMQPLLARLDRHQWQLTLYFTGNSVDEQTRQARRRVDGWRDVASSSDQRLATQIEADGVDILLDLAGHTSWNRMGLLAQRAAPVQATFLGYPGSTGVPNIDWILADGVVAPEGCEHQFSERVARLPHTVFCYCPEVDYPSPPFDANLLERPLTFGSFNNVPKLTPHTVRLWSRILHALPDARLLLKAPSFKDAGAVEHFQARFAAEGICAERLEFRGPVGLDLMMAEYGDVDIALDPVPYNGGTTSHQALWMGVPLISLRGEQFVSRMGASLLMAAGLDDWIADHDEAYVAIAVEKARDRQALLELKRGLRGRLLQRPGWDIEAYTRAFEEQLRGMWRAWVEETGPGPAP